MSEIKTGFYGTCPKCGCVVISRERRPDGNDRCAKGCVYPSKDTIPHEKAEK